MKCVLLLISKRSKPKAAFKLTHRQVTKNTGENTKLGIVNWQPIQMKIITWIYYGRPVTTKSFDWSFK